MIDTTRRDPASERIQANLEAHFDSEVGRLDRAAERFEAPGRSCTARTGSRSTVRRSTGSDSAPCSASSTPWARR
jgi:hypothetical protein